MDKDGTYDRLDNCPENKFINTTSFVKHTTVDFIPSWTSEPAPIWRVLDNGMEIRQDGKTRKAVALIGMYPVLYGANLCSIDRHVSSVNMVQTYVALIGMYPVLI